MPGITGCAGVSSPNAAELHVLGRLEMLLGKEQHLVLEEQGPHGGRGLGRERRVEVETADVGADPSGLGNDVEIDHGGGHELPPNHRRLIVAATATAYFGAFTGR